MQPSENRLQQEALPGKPNWQRYIILILACTLLSTLIATYTTAVSTQKGNALTGFWFKAAGPGFLLSCFWALLRYSYWILGSWIVNDNNYRHGQAYRREESRRQQRLFVQHMALLGPACVRVGDSLFLLRGEREHPRPFCSRLQVPQFQSEEPTKLSEPVSVPEEHGNTDEDDVSWDRWTIEDDEAAVEEDTAPPAPDATPPLPEDAATASDSELRIPSTLYLPARLATLMAEWSLPALNTPIPVSWCGTEEEWLRFRQHASEVGLFLTAKPHKLCSPEEIDQVIDALHAQTQLSYHLLAGLVSATATLGTSDNTPAAEAAFAILASNRGAGCSLSRPVVFTAREHLDLASRNAALAKPPESFFSLDRDTPSVLSDAGWQIDALQHGPFWGNPGELGCWIMAAMALEAAKLRQQAVGWQGCQQDQLWAGIALPPVSPPTGAMA